MNKEVIIVIIALVLTLGVLIENFILRRRLQKTDELIQDAIAESENTLKKLDEHVKNMQGLLDIIDKQQAIISIFDTELEKFIKEMDSDNNRYTGAKKRTPPGNV